jgi:hypothetical protein
MQYCYLPYLINKNTATIAMSANLLFSLQITSIFMIGLYSLQLSYYFVYPNTNNKTSIGLSIIYIKYLLDIILNPSIYFQSELNYFYLLNIV